MRSNVENIEPRRRLLEVWSAVGDFAVADRKWRWQGRTAANSISDAEQLLCVLLPATTLPALRLADPNETSEDAKFALRGLGSESQIPRTIIEALEDYLGRYTAKNGLPTFSGGSAYLPLTPGEKLTTEQRDVDLLISFTTSVSLCLSALEFLQDYTRSGARGTWLSRAGELQKGVNTRLTAALVGLLRGFTTNPIALDEPEGATLVRMLDQNETGERDLIVAEFNRRMSPVRGRLGEARLGIELAPEIEDPDTLFELGWTWSIAEGAPIVQLDDPADTSALPFGDGIAQPAPFLYFTLMALDTIEQLTRDRTRVLGVLSPAQDRLASALGLRRDLTQIYWSRLARFGSGRWPLEDLPWRTTDDTENDYYSLMVSAVLIQDLRQRTANESDLQRLVPLLSELANRARITRRPLRDDPMLELHEPGFKIELVGSEKLGPAMSYQLSDFAPVLFKRCTQLAELTIDPKSRDALINLATQVWNHLAQRRINGGKANGLWDDPARVFTGMHSRHDDPLWSTNARVVDALVSSASALSTRQAHNDLLSDTAAAMVSEAEFLLNEQQMATPALNYSPMQRGLEEIRRSLQRARSLIETQPSTAIALCVTAVTQLDKNVMARENASDGREQ